MMFKIISCQELDEEEHFTDVIDPTEDTSTTPSIAQNDLTEEAKNAVHVTSSQGHVFVDSSRTHGYQANARNPLYSGADNSCLWEVMKLSRHYHPSVSRFAQNLLQVLPSAKLNYKDCHFETNWKTSYKHFQNYCNLIDG